VPVATKVGGKVLRIFEYCKTKQRQKQATSDHTTNSAEAKDSSYITCCKCHVQPSQFKSHQCQYHRGEVKERGRFYAHFVKCYAGKQAVKGKGKFLPRTGHEGP
jgi:hypothetical protein